MSFILNRMDRSTGRFPVKGPIPKMTLNDMRLWPWNCHDTSTWKYIGFDLSFHRGKPVISWHENPGFAYSHLDKESIHA